MSKKKSDRDGTIVTPKKLHEGDHICFNGGIYRFIRYNKADPRILEVRALGSLEESQIHQKDLILYGGDEVNQPIYAHSLDELYAKMEVQFAPPPGLSDIQYPATSSDKGLKRLLANAEALIRSVEIVDERLDERRRRAIAMGERFEKTRAVIGICETLPVNVRIAPSTYHKYKGIYDKYGGNAEQIAASMHRSSFNGTYMSRAVLHLVDTTIMRYYRKSGYTGWYIHKTLLPYILEHTRGLWVDTKKCPDGRVPEQLVSRLLNSKIPIEDILNHPEEGKLLSPVKLPSKAWFYQYLRWFTHLPDSGKAVIVARYGLEKWEAEHLVFDTFVKNAQFSRQYVFPDHYLLDTFTLDEDGDPIRLWLTIYACCWSRSILGFALLYEEPCIESVLSGLKNCIYPKEDFLQSLGVVGEWVCYGIPLELYLDNAWAHHSHTLIDLAAALARVNGKQYDKMTVLWRAPYKARHGAIVEAINGNLSARLKELAGGIKSSHPKHVRSAAEKALLTYEDMLGIIAQFVVEHQNTPQRALDGMTPNEKFLQGLGARQLDVPPLSPSVQRLFLRKMNSPRHMKAVTGVSAFGMQYVPINGQYIPSRGRDGKYIDYEVRYDVLDISRLSLFREGEWIGDVYSKQLRLPDGTHEVRSVAEREMAKKYAKTHPGTWLEYFRRAETTEAKRAEERRKTRRLQDKAPRVTESAPTPVAAQTGTDGAQTPAPLPMGKPRTLTLVPKADVQSDAARDLIASLFKS